MDARRTAGLNNAPYCMWSPTPPLELKGAPDEALSVNAGFITFGNFKKLNNCIGQLVLNFLSLCNNLYRVPMQLFYLVMWKARNWIGRFGVYQLSMHMSVIMSRCDLFTWTYCFHLLFSTSTSSFANLIYCS